MAYLCMIWCINHIFYYIRLIFNIAHIWKYTYIFRTDFWIIIQILFGIYFGSIFSVSNLVFLLFSSPIFGFYSKNVFIFLFSAKATQASTSKSLAVHLRNHRESRTQSERDPLGRASFWNIQDHGSGSTSVAMVPKSRTQTGY